MDKIINGKYNIKKQIGKGAQAKVFACEDISNNKKEYYWYF